MTWQEQMNVRATDAKLLAEQVRNTIGIVEQAATQTRATIEQVRRGVEALKALYSRVDRLENIRPVVQQAKLILPVLSVGLSTYDVAWPEPFDGPYDVTVSKVSDTTLTVIGSTPEGVRVQADTTAPILAGVVVELLAVGLTVQPVPISEPPPEGV